MPIFGPTWDSKNFKRAEAAVHSLTDQTELAQVAKTCRHAYLRGIAAGKLTDPVILLDIIQTDAHADVRASVIWNECFTDRAALEKIAVSDEDMDIRWTANRRLEKMRKPEVEKEKESRRQRIRNMTDPTELANIAIGPLDNDLRSLAINNRHLTDQTVFAHIAEHESDFFLKRSAIRRITDTAVLASLKAALCDKNRHVMDIDHPPRTNEAAMELHFDRCTIYRCGICGKEERRFD